MADKEPDPEDAQEADKENEGRDSVSWPGPHTVIVPRAENGFGFTLRHFIVYPPESAVPGDVQEDEPEEVTLADGRQRKRSRLSELEPMDTIFVKQVKEDGPAQHAGLHTGDRIVSVNGETVTGKSYAQVIALIQSSDSSLKLLVVPKDEDILQMAYQNSAYNQGQLPYRGDASDIPKPPSTTGHPSSRGPPVRPKPDPKPLGKPPVGPRYKSELRMVPEDECSRLRYSDPGSGPPSFDSVLGRRRTSTGSLGSVSSGTSSSSTREHVIMPLAELAPSRLAKVEDLGSPGEEPSGSYNPPAPKRTSSRNIVLSQFQQLENRSGSLDSISRSSDSSNSRRSVESDPPMSRKEYGIPLHVRRSQENVRLSNENLASVRLSGEPHRASAESISQLRHTHENLRHSSDDLLHKGLQSEDKHRLSKSSTTSRLPSAPSHRPVYTRSHTTSTLVNPPSYSSPSPLSTDCQRREASHGSWSRTVAPTQVTFSSPKHQSQTTGRSVHHSDHTYSRPSSWSTPSSTYSQSQDHHDNSQEKDFNYGAAFKFTFQEGSVDHDPSHFVDVTHVDPDSGTNMTFASGRVGGSDRQINMVTERLRMFESADSFDSLSSGGSGRHSRPLSPRETRSLPHSYKGVPTMGFDTVASRVNQFENFSDQENHSGDEKSRMRKVSTESAPECQRKMSREERWRRDSPTSLSERNLAQALPPSEIDTVPGSPPATINIYFKGENSKSQSSVTLQPSPERILSELDQKYSSSSCSDFTMVDGRDRSPLGSQDLQMSPPSSRRIHKPALRQASYLTAIHSPHNKTAPPSFLDSSSASDRDCPTSECSQDSSQDSNTPGRGLLSALNTMMAVMTPEGVPPSSSSTSLELSAATAPSPSPSPSPIVASSASDLSTTPVSSCAVMLRQPSTTVSAEEREAKLVRRTSYLMATGKDRPQLSSMPMETSKSDSHLQLQVSSPLPISQTDTQPVESKPITSSRPGIKKVGLRLDLSQIPEEPPPPPSSLPPADEGDEQTEQAEPVQEPEKAQQQQLLPPRLMEPDVFTTPTKTSNIRKLKAFFGEKTPRIMEATGDPRRIFDMPASVGDIIKEGTLNCKVSITDGKRASDRSWKPMWVMLRKKFLYLFKDKNAASTSPTLTDEQPIPIKSSIVDIAYDYTKKKHVFRLTTYNGSEYLFQAEERETMLDWIRLVQMNYNVEDEIAAEQESRVTAPASDVMEKKTVQLEKSAKSSPQAVHKSAKKVSTKSLRSKSPAAHSPGVKQKKQTFDKVDFTDSPKPKDKETKEYSRTWKSKFMFKRGGSSSSVPAEINGTFNVPLECCPRSPANEYIPLVVEVCTAIVEERGLENQGIYRVPGNTGAVNALQEELNKVLDGEEVDTSNDKWLDVNVISSLLKSFFRKLPEALITDELYDKIISANRIENPEKRMLRLKQLLHRLPDQNFETFRFLAQHLSRVASMGHINKMDARNLAIVFGPTLVRTTDESMITMVKDMSDQCRIVESIILHHDWFFLSWEEDHEVPVDEENADAPVSGMNQELLSKAECLELGERGRDLSAKDLFSSVISAANRKIKKKDKKSSESGSIDVDPPNESGYNERNIDREIELRRNKETTTTQKVTKSGSKESVTTTTSSKEERQVTVSLQDTSASASRDIFAAKRAFMSSRTDSETSGTTTSSSGSSNDSWNNIKLIKYPAIKVPTWSSPVTENAKPTMHRRYSEDSSERRGDDEIVQVGRRHGGYAPQVAQHLRVLEREKLALRQHKELRRQEHERRAIDKRRIEHELQKTRQELETEDSLDYLLTKKMESIRLTDNSSITSDYSTTSSSNIPFEPKIPGSRQGNLSDYSSSASPTSLNLDRSPVSRSSTLFDESDSFCSPSQGGKYFVMSAGNRMSRDDTELYRTPNLRSPPGFDTRKVVGRGTLTRKKRSSGSEDAGEEGSNPPFSRSSSFQRSASLDSLRDFYKDHAFLSDDSDEFVDSITATLDQKMRIFGESRTPAMGGSISPQAEGIKVDWVSRSVGLGDMHKNFSEGSLGDSSFRDPSLHRLQQSEPKTDFPHPDSHWGHFCKTGVSATLPVERGRENGTGIERHSVRRDVHSYCSRTEDSHPITKSQKTDANMSKKEQDALASDYTRAIRKSTEKLYGSREHLLGSCEPLDDCGANAPSGRPENTKVLRRQEKAPSVSPPLTRPTAKNRSIQRRHTVGGTKDSEHFRALMTLNQPCHSDDRLSACPVVHDSCPGDSRTMVGWLEDQERFRGVHSSPTLHSGHSQLPSSKYSYSQNTDDCQQLGPRLPPEGRSNIVRNKSSLPGPSSDKSSPVHNGAPRRPHTFTFESSI